MKQRLTFVTCLAVTVAFGTQPAAAKPFPVSVSVPDQASLKSFVSGRFHETVTCQTACKVNTSVVIRSSEARRLGFSHVRGRFVTIATNKARLEAQKPTKLSFVLTADAKRRLPGAKSGIDIFGSVRSTPVARPSTNYSVGWASALT